MTKKQQAVENARNNKRFVIFECNTGKLRDVSTLCKDDCFRVLFIDIYDKPLTDELIRAKLVNFEAMSFNDFIKVADSIASNILKAKSKGLLKAEDWYYSSYLDKTNLVYNMLSRLAAGEYNNITIYKTFADIVTDYLFYSI